MSKQEPSQPDLNRATQIEGRASPAFGAETRLLAGTAPMTRATHFVLPVKLRFHPHYFHVSRLWPRISLGPFWLHPDLEHISPLQLKF